MRLFEIDTSKFDKFGQIEAAMGFFKQILQANPNTDEDIALDQAMREANIIPTENPELYHELHRQATNFIKDRFNNASK